MFFSEKIPHTQNCEVDVLLCLEGKAQLGGDQIANFVRATATADARFQRQRRQQVGQQTRQIRGCSIRHLIDNEQFVWMNNAKMVNWKVNEMASKVQK